MSSEIYVAIISGIVTILVGALTAFVAYKGAIKGAKTQIEHEKFVLETQKREQREFTEAAIQEFIMREVRNNFNNFILSNDFLMELLEEQEPRQYGHSLSFKTSEFENFKHELIKSKNNLVKDILLYYEVFNLLEDKFDLKMFTQEEFTKLKNSVTLFKSNEKI